VRVPRLRNEVVLSAELGSRVGGPLQDQGRRFGQDKGREKSVRAAMRSSATSSTLPKLQDLCLGCSSVLVITGPRGTSEKI
jgi:hypothetical protein